MRLALFVSAGLVSAILVACGGAQSYTASLSGANEVPPVTTTSGTGSVTATLDGTAFSLSGTFSGLSGAATAAHVHAGAAGANGSVVFALAVDAGTTAGSGSLSATQTLTADQVSSLNAGGLYVNVHTAMSAGGEIRGNLTKQ